MIYMDRLLLKPLAYGRTAEIYEWNDREVLKLFHDWFPAEDVEYEARIAKAVSSSGFRVPEVGEIVEVNGRFGLAYERLHGVSLWEAIIAKPWALHKHASLLARLQAEIHAITDVSGLPVLSDKLERRIRNAGELSPEIREACLSVLSRLPKGKNLCHGDFHPNNVILTESGPVVIDWIDAAIGSPLADVARTMILALGEKATAGQTSILEKVYLDWGLRLYHKRYFDIRSGGEEECKAWLPLVAAARLSEGIEELAPWLISQAEVILEYTRGQRFFS